MSSIGDILEVQARMKLMQACLCQPDDTNRMKEKVDKVIRSPQGQDDDPPGRPFLFQYEVLCLMEGLESNLGRGGLLCNEAGSGKTLNALLHARINCSTSHTTLVFATKALIEDVWEPQIKVWLKPEFAEYTKLLTAADAENGPSRRAGHIILANTDAMVRGGIGTWEALKKLNPEYIFVDEGGLLGHDSQAQNMNETQKMIGRIQTPESITWVVTAAPFKANPDDDNFRKVFDKAYPNYKAITEKKTPDNVLSKRVAKANKMFKDLKVGGKDLSEDDMNFFIAFSTAQINDFLPIAEWVQKTVRYDEDPAAESKRQRKEHLLESLVEAQTGKTKVLVAGMSKDERIEIESWLEEFDIKFTSTEQTHDVVRKFANDDSTVCLMHKTLKVGIDSLKVAQKVIFWDEQHADFKNVSDQLTIIKRIRRLGSLHKKVYIEHYPVKKRLSAVKKPRLS